MQKRRPILADIKQYSARIAKAKEAAKEADEEQVPLDLFEAIDEPLDLSDESLEILKDKEQVVRYQIQYWQDRAYNDDEQKDALGYLIKANEVNVKIDEQDGNRQGVDQWKYTIKTEKEEKKKYAQDEKTAMYYYNQKFNESGKLNQQIANMENDEEQAPLDLFAAIDEAIDHADLISAIDEAVMHADLLSAIDEAVAFTTKQETASWGTITLSACGVAAAIGGAGYLVTRTQALKDDDDIYESLV